MPELPEVEITARLLDEELAGVRIEAVRSPGLNAVKTFDPPIESLVGQRISGLRRCGKHLVVDTDEGSSLLIHLMSAGRLQLFDKPASMRDRSARVLLGLDDGHELRLREFGTHQRAWVKLLATSELEADDAISGLGPEAWPDPPQDLAALLAAHGARPLYSVLRDQHVICGIGRSWVDEILWSARLSPFARASELDDAGARRLRAAIIDRLGGAIAHYEEVLALPLPDKLPLPLQVHRHDGQQCPRCGAKIEAVHFEDYVLCYCPAEQTAGKVFKDRRLSRLLR